jgi:hypothetical protein
MVTVSGAVSLCAAAIEAEMGLVSNDTSKRQFNNGIIG